MAHCLKCGQNLQDEQSRPVPSISGSVMGDEYTESYFFCGTCEVYTVLVTHDRFLGEDEDSFQGPWSREEGEAKIEILRRCPDPLDKKCRCEAHRAYFGGWLD